MTIKEAGDILRANVGRTVRVTPIGGEPEVLTVMSVDGEGFTYKLRTADSDQTITHWWPFDEVFMVDLVEET